MKDSEQNKHGKIICRICESIIFDCGCIDHDYEIEKAVCNNCRVKSENIEPHVEDLAEPEKTDEKFSKVSDDEKTMRTKELLSNAKAYIVFQISNDNNMSCIINTNNINFAERFGLLVFASTHCKKIIEKLLKFFNEA